MTGSVGAAAGNAGRDGIGIHDGITKVHGYTTRGEYVTINRGDYSYGYRKVEGLDIIITSVSYTHLTLPTIYSV